tara:strand:- start:631 stop:1392 length:762 start_codon:yes stop_codon:yes gene_type:complete
MVLEKLMSPDKYKSSYLKATLFGIAISAIGLTIGYNLFPADAALASIFFILIAAVPFFRTLMVQEERAEKTSHNIKEMIIRNKYAFEYFFFFYAGIFLTYFVGALVLPEAIQAALFENQFGVFKSVLGSFANQEHFYMILFNNLKIVILAIILSLIYGAGALMILTWNASVLGVFLAQQGVYLWKFLPHAGLEFLGFFAASIAGGILSAGVEKHEVGTKNFKHVYEDSLFLAVSAVLLIIIAAIVEVYVFPIF